MKAILNFATVVSLLSMASAVNAQSPIADVALTQDNLLRGQLVTREGQPEAGAQISVSSGQDVICRTVTNDRGIFAVKVAKGGMYILSHDEMSFIVRAWTEKAAPPSATNGFLMVSDEHVSRAHLSSGRFSLSSGRYGPIETAAIIGAMGIVIYLAADDDGS